MNEIKNESANFKSWDKLTPEEQEQFDLGMWTGVQPNSAGAESVFKYLPLDPSAVCTTVQTLATLRAAVALDAEAHGLHDDWQHMDADYVLKLLKLRAMTDAGEIC